MSQTVTQRWIFSLFGAAAGFALWALIDALEHDLLQGRLPMVLGVLLITFTWGFYAMAGPLKVQGAVMRALPLAALVSGLVFLVSLRWPGPEGMFDTPSHLLAAFAVTVLPVPFLLAGARTSWRDYPALFEISWGIIARGILAFFFTGIVWAVIGLSALLLNMVGIDLFERFLFHRFVPLVISGAAFGLAVAVVHELSDMLSPRLIHWLLRLLLPPVTLVSAVFVVAVLLRGYEDGLRGLSPALVLLSMAAAGIALVCVALDESDSEASASPVILWSARVMVVLILVLAALGLRAIWIRIGAEGYTPNRLFVLALALIGVAYGLGYTAALLRGRGFSAWIRDANPWLALMVIGCAFFWLTPLLNAEAISARDQAARLIDGRKTADGAYGYMFSRYGHAGEAARQRVIAHATETGDEALLAAVNTTGYLDWAAAETASVVGEDERRIEVLGALETELKLVPETSRAAAREMLAVMETWTLEDVRSACGNRVDGSDSPGCLMVMADLLPARPGDEAIFLLNRGSWFEGFGLLIDQNGSVLRSDIRGVDGRYLDTDQIRALFMDWSANPPEMEPAMINQLGIGERGIYFAP